MNSEKIIEEGTVVSAENGFAVVAVARTAACDECSAKIICGSGSGGENLIKVSDEFGVKRGDTVRFEIGGGTLLSASFLLYGIPLLLIIIGILIGLSIFSPYKSKELYSFLFGIGLVVVYYFVAFRLSARKEITPKIVSLRSNN